MSPSFHDEIAIIVFCLVGFHFAHCKDGYFRRVEWKYYYLDKDNSLQAFIARRRGTEDENRLFCDDFNNVMHVALSHLDRIQDSSSNVDQFKVHTFQA